MWLLQPICQVAYFVADAVAAAQRHSRTFGSGPFFVFEHVPYKRNIHRGVEREFDHTTVIGQWGGVMVEFMQQHNHGPSMCHDMYPRGSGRWGIHHVALVVDDVESTRLTLEAHGLPTVCEFHTTLDIPCFFADGLDTYGHFVEYYPRVPLLIHVHEMVANAAKGFDGSNPIRQLTADMLAPHAQHQSL
jgi:hypothetical protein